MDSGKPTVISCNKECINSTNGSNLNDINKGGYESKDELQNINNKFIDMFQALDCMRICSGCDMKRNNICGDHTNRLVEMILEVGKL